jgi:hypothetical protein
MLFVGPLRRALHILKVECNLDKEWPVIGKPIKGLVHEREWNEIAIPI